MKSVYYWTANLIFITHVLLGAYYLIGWQFEQYHILYWILLTGWIGSWLIFGNCPLTKAEFYFRSKYDGTVDTDREIIQYYIQKLFNVFVPSKIIIVWGVFVYVLLLSLSLLTYL